MPCNSKLSVWILTEPIITFMTNCPIAKAMELLQSCTKPSMYHHSILSPVVHVYQSTSPVVQVHQSQWTLCCQGGLSPHPADMDHPVLTWKGWVTAHLPGIPMRCDEVWHWGMMMECLLAIIFFYVHIYLSGIQSNNSMATCHIICFISTHWTMKKVDFLKIS